MKGDAMNDGGPAFPQNDAGVNRINNHDGMSMRAYFTGHALANLSMFHTHLFPTSEDIANRAVDIADATIKRLAKK